jgi:serine/threonine protein kinase
MAIVLRMEDSLLRRPVAVKMLRVRSEGGDTIGRILDEAQIAAQLDHPSILTVHEIGVDDEGQVRMVMPLVQGGQIDQFVNEHRHEWWTTAAMMQQVAWGLAFAHQKGVVHRDVKPANIVLGEHGDAYLADWGIALLVGAPGEAESRLRLHRGPGIDQQGIEETVSEEIGDGGLNTTVHGQIVGTPAYMAPEAFGSGTGAIVGAHSDVWSLGVILYELLAGRHPYRDQMTRVRLHEMRQFLTALRATPLRRLAPRVPGRLAAVCSRAMQADPAERFPDAGEFARALQAVAR